MLLQQVARQTHNKAKAKSKSTTSCRTNSKSYGKLDNLSHSKSTTNVRSKLHATISKSYSKSHNLLYDKSTANRSDGVLTSQVAGEAQTPPAAICCGFVVVRHVAQQIEASGVWVMGKLNPAAADSSCPPFEVRLTTSKLHLIRSAVDLLENFDSLSKQVEFERAPDSCRRADLQLPPPSWLHCWTGDRCPRVSRDNCQVTLVQWPRDHTMTSC